MKIYRTLGEEYSEQALTWKQKVNIAKNIFNTTKKRTSIGVHKMFIFFTGIPGSGKSTIAKFLCEKYGFNVVATDSIKRFLQEMELSFTKPDLFQIQAMLIKDLLKEGYNVISDSNSSLSKHRYRLKIMCKNYKYNAVNINIICDPVICHKRVIKRNHVTDPQLIDKWYQKIYEYMSSIQKPRKAIAINGSLSKREIQSELMLLMNMYKS